MNHDNDKFSAVLYRTITVSNWNDIYKKITMISLKCIVNGCAISIFKAIIVMPVNLFSCKADKWKAPIFYNNALR